MDPDFVKGLKELIPQYLRNCCLKPKRIGGQVIKGKDLHYYFKVCLQNHTISVSEVYWGYIDSIKRGRERERERERHRERETQREKERETNTRLKLNRDG